MFFSVFSYSVGQYLSVKMKNEPNFWKKRVVYIPMYYMYSRYKSYLMSQTSHMKNEFPIAMSVELENMFKARLAYSGALYVNINHIEPRIRQLGSTSISSRKVGAQQGGVVEKSMCASSKKLRRAAGRRMVDLVGCLKILIKCIDRTKFNTFVRSVHPIRIENYR